MGFRFGFGSFQYHKARGVEQVARNPPAGNPTWSDFHTWRVPPYDMPCLENMGFRFGFDSFQYQKSE